MNGAACPAIGTEWHLLDDSTRYIECAPMWYAYKCVLPVAKGEGVVSIEFSEYSVRSRCGSPDSNQPNAPKTQSGEFECDPFPFVRWPLFVSRRPILGKTRSGQIKLNTWLMMKVMATLTASIWDICCDHLSSTIRRLIAQRMRSDLDGLRSQSKVIVK